MILIFGGIFQGKLDFAKESFKLEEEDIYICAQDKLTVDSDKKCIYLIDQLVRAYINKGLEEESLKEYINSLDLKNKIVISRDLSQGVVPLERADRMARDWGGRLITYLASRSDEVYRVMAGISQRLK